MSEGVGRITEKAPDCGHRDHGLYGHHCTTAAEAWDAACQALAWAMENGPVEQAATYVATNNPYRTPSGETP